MTGGGWGGIRDEVSWGRDAEPPRAPGFLITHGRAAVMLAACVAVAAAVVLVHHRPRPAPPRPVPIRVVNGNTVAISISGATGAELTVQSLQAGSRAAATVLTIAATGLRPGLDYIATAGECAGGRPRNLAVSSGQPDPGTGILVLSVDSPAGSADAPMWVQVSNASGVELGAVRGPFLLPYSGAAIAPGQAVCR